MARHGIAIFTAMFGAIDRVRSPVEQDTDVDFVCFTDRPDLVDPGWQVIEEAPRFDDPRLAAKVHKLRPFDVLGDHRWALWLDANVVLDHRSFAREAIEQATAAGAGLTAFRHPHRSCIYDEARILESQPRNHGQPIRAQVESYRREGHPARAGLFGCGGLAWDLASGDAEEIGKRWFDECERWTTRDQLSLPVVARRMGRPPGVFTEHLFRHRPDEALSCWLRRRPWGADLLDRTRGAAHSFTGAELSTGAHPVPRAWWTVGNSWFDVAPHGATR